MHLFVNEGMMATVQDLLLTEPEDAKRTGTRSFNILGVKIAATTIDRTVETLTSWIETGSYPRLVTFTNVHMLTESYWKPAFQTVLQEMDLNCPDGMPLVWIGKFLGSSVERVAGPDFMPAFCKATAERGYRHFFYGGDPGVAKRVVAKLSEVSPDLRIAGSWCPPFGAVNEKERERVIRAINASKADVLWVCLGCPRQEMWMLEHRDRLNVRVMLSVGQAFNILAGTRPRAPKVMRELGLEWLYRMMAEPKRLGGRYFTSNLTFLYLLVNRAITGHWPVRVTGKYASPTRQSAAPPARVTAVKLVSSGAQSQD
jgi:N-acetylglucosaminyldiphosphoundecaprenol N-acetyl-beta-D-mannosaminyltransferase